MRPRESWAILGANGSGKSSLLRLLRGEMARRGGRTFRILGRAETSPIGVREHIGLVGPELQQEYVRRDWALAVETVVRSGFTDSVFPPEAASASQLARVAEVLAELGIAPLADRSILELSGGEARKVLLARALVARPALLFLDEPCHGLDASSRGAFLALVSQVARDGTPVVLATHRHDELVPEIAQVAVLHGGKVLAMGQGGRSCAAMPTGRARARLPLSWPAARRGPAPERLRARSFRSRHADAERRRATGLARSPWSVRAGENWAVRGRNGSGKSTLLRLVVGDEQAMPGGRVARLDLGERACVWEVKARVGIVSPELQARHRVDSAGRGGGRLRLLGQHRPRCAAFRGGAGRGGALHGAARRGTPSPGAASTPSPTASCASSWWRARWCSIPSSWCSTSRATGSTGRAGRSS